MQNDFVFVEMKEQKESTDILNDLNNQFKELIDLVEKENTTSISIKSFQKKKKSKKKFWILSLIIILSIIIYSIRCNEELSYNIYFIFLSFIRLILIKVSCKGVDSLEKFIFYSRFFRIGIGQLFIQVNASSEIHFIIIHSMPQNAV